MSVKLSQIVFHARRVLRKSQAMDNSDFGMDESPERTIFDRTPLNKSMPALTNPNNSSLSDLARDAATKDSAEVLRLLGTSPAGLTEEEAAARLEQYGPNEVGREKHEGWLQRLYIAARNPLVILLTVLAISLFRHRRRYPGRRGDAAHGGLGGVAALRPGDARRTPPRPSSRR